MDTTKVCYMLRTCSADGTSSHGFRYPTEVGAEVECPDWDDDPTRNCGGGLHGLPNGIGDAGLIPQSGDVWWQVWQVQPGDWFAPIRGKSRWRRGRLRFSRQQHGNSTDARDDAITFLRQCGCPLIGIVWDRVTSGNCGQSTSGCSGQSTSGNCGQSTSGYSGQSTSGYSGRAAAGLYGGISIRWFDYKMNTYRVRCGEVGCGDGSDGLLKANTWYRVSADGQWVEDGPVEKK